MYLRRVASQFAKRLVNRTRKETNKRPVARPRMISSVPGQSMTASDIAKLGVDGLERLKSVKHFKAIDQAFLDSVMLHSRRILAEHGTQLARRTSSTTTTARGNV